MEYRKELTVILTKIGRDNLRKILTEWDNYRYKMSNRKKDARHDEFMDSISEPCVSCLWPECSECDKN
jgi:hypothetical protein